MTACWHRWLLHPLLVMVAVLGWVAGVRIAAAASPAAGSIGAATGILIVREDSAIARQAAELLGKEAAVQRWAIMEVTVALERPAPDLQVRGDQIIVALGSRALAAATRQAGGRPVVAAFVTRSAVEEAASGENVSAIVLDQPLERWASLLRIAFPDRHSVGLLVGADTIGTARALERKLADQHLTLATETAVSVERVMPALERLLPHMGVLLALPDPLVHNRNTVQALLLTTYRAGIPVVAYSESYERAGAVVALYSTVPQIAAQIVVTLRQWQEGRRPPAIQAPVRYTVGINTAVARSLGLQLPSADELADRLRAADAHAVSSRVTFESHRLSQGGSGP
jgi:ABC-type uncharacterized transport system substrate-binding protein